MHKQARTSEWRDLDDAARQYHLRQWESEKESTRAFSEFIASNISVSNAVIDLGCGAGACTASIARRYPQARFTGVDLSKELIGIAADRGSLVENLKFIQGDWFSMPSEAADGVISLQTMSWLPEFEGPLEQIFAKLAPRWFAATSLFYEGDISCRIEVTEHGRDRTAFYNVYSLPAVSRLCEKQGYKLTRAERFNIGIDLAKPANLDAMGTYTRHSEGERLQISGPLLMPWYMVMIERQNP